MRITLVLNRQKSVLLGVNDAIQGIYTQDTAQLFFNTFNESISNAICVCHIPLRDFRTKLL